MQSSTRLVSAAVAITALLFSGGDAASETADHLQCFKVKDTLALSAIVDLESARPGTSAGCKVSNAVFYCVPAIKTVIGPVAEEYMHGSDPGDRICYRVSCRDQGPPSAELLVADQFGSRAISGRKTSLLCTPAVKVLPGWLGRTEIEPEVLDPLGNPYTGDQYWTDTDGIAPATAGCHYPFQDRSIAGVCSSPLNAASRIGEYCNPAAGDAGHAEGFAAGALVETNPGANVCHAHADGLGHPDVYDCDAFCKGVGSPSHTGACVVAPCEADAAIPSAKCVCTPALGGPEVSRKPRPRDREEARASAPVHP